MDELDGNLMEAWHDVRMKLSRDPAARGRRYERGLRAALRRPVRAWCVSVKASDTRIEHAAMLNGDAAVACDRRERHGVVLFGSLVRHLVRPVVIPWPGMCYDVAARELGIDVRTMVDWMDKRWVCSRKEKVPGRRGGPSRVVWTGGGGVDVCFPQGREAHWGSLWQGLWRRVPEGFEQTVERVPRLRPVMEEINEREPMRAEAHTPPPPETIRQKDVQARSESFRGRGFRGWDWVCPGRELADGTWAHCGRVCKKLVAPLPVWTIDRAMPASMRAEARTPPAPERFVGQGLGSGLGDGVSVADYEAKRVRLACARCWNVQHTPSDPDAAWNQLVTAISGGLLYGREVQRPTGYVDGQEV